MKFLRRTPANADGFSTTDEVKAKLVKEGDARLILLRNGVNLFRFNPREFQHITVGKAEQGAFHLLGHAAIAAQPGGGVVLATFPTARGAENAHSAVAAAYAGLGRKRSMLKWLLILGGGYMVLSFLFGSAGAAAGAAHVGAAPDSSAQLVQRFAQAPGQGHPPAASGGFNAAEPTLEQMEKLAAGEYQFSPKIAAPQVQAPDLNCAPAK